MNRGQAQKRIKWSYDSTEYLCAFPIKGVSRAEAILNSELEHLGYRAYVNQSYSDLNLRCRVKPIENVIYRLPSPSTLS